MNPALRHSDRLHHDQFVDHAEPPPQAFLEPRGEGIWFAVVCVVASAVVYFAVMLAQ